MKEKKHNDHPPEFTPSPGANGEMTGESRSELLDSILDSTKAAADDQQLFPRIVEHAKSVGMDRAFGFETVCELVRFVVQRRFGNRLEHRFSEEMTEWVANVIYDDPLARAKTERLWGAVVRLMN